MHLKLLQTKKSKKAEATADLIDNKNADEITKVSRSSSQNRSEAVEGKNENIVFDRPKKEINIQSQPAKFTTKNWIETNDDSCGTCNTSSQI